MERVTASQSMGSKTFNWITIFGSNRRHDTDTREPLLLLCPEIRLFVISLVDTRAVVYTLITHYGDSSHDDDHKKRSLPSSPAPRDTGTEGMVRKSERQERTGRGSEFSVRDIIHDR